MAILRKHTGAILNRPVQLLYPLKVDPEKVSIVEEDPDSSPQVQSVSVYLMQLQDERI